MVNEIVGPNGEGFHALYNIVGKYAQPSLSHPHIYKPEH